MRANAAPPRYVAARADRVIGTRGRPRLVLVVRTCCFCGASHVHTAAPDTEIFRRKASCHGGKYVLAVAFAEGSEAVA